MTVSNKSMVDWFHLSRGGHMPPNDKSATWGGGLPWPSLPTAGAGREGGNLTDQKAAMMLPEVAAALHPVILLPGQCSRRSTDIPTCPTCSHLSGEHGLSGVAPVFSGGSCAPPYTPYALPLNKRM